MKKILIVVSLLALAIGALLCAFILKDMQVSAPEAAAGLVWLLSMNTITTATVRTVRKSAGVKSTSPSFALMYRSEASTPEFRRPAA